MEGLMKTGQIMAITGGVIAGTLLLGGGAFAAGVALSEPIAEERIERVEQRGVDREDFMQRLGDRGEYGRDEARQQGQKHDRMGVMTDGRWLEQRGEAEHDCDAEHRDDEDRERDYSQRGRPDTAPSQQLPGV